MKETTSKRLRMCSVFPFIWYCRENRWMAARGWGFGGREGWLQRLWGKFLERRKCSVSWTLWWWLHDSVYQNSQNCGLDFLGVSPSADAVYLIETMRETASWGEDWWIRIREISTKRISQQHSYQTPSHLLKSLTLRTDNIKKQCPFLSKNSTTWLGSLGICLLD